MRAGLFGLLGLMLAACGRIGYEQVQLGEWPGDGGPTDIAAAPADGPPADVAADGPAADAPVDGPVADRPPDAPPDAPPDLPVDNRLDAADVLPEVVSVTEVFGRRTGTRYLDWCPDDQVLIGLEGAAESATGTIYTNLAGRCGPPQLTASPPYRVTSIPYRTTLPARGSGQVTFAHLCPTGQAIVGIEGRADPDLRALSFVCADLVVTGGPTRYELVPGSNRTVEPLMNVAGGTPFSASCQPGHVARGTYMWAGPWIQAFGLLCSTVSVRP
jgi:hypothetical protein